VREHLLSKSEVLSSNPSTTGRKKGREGKREGKEKKASFSLKK
jgi:hypothetical protein